MEYAAAQARRQMEMLPDSKVAFLEHLSDQLGCELTFHIKYAQIFNHPLLKRCQGKSAVLKDFSASTLSKRSCASDDVVSAQGMVAKFMMFVQSGKLEYVKKSEYMPEETLNPADWICEAALWCTWMHQGTTQAVVESELIYVDAAEFGKAVQEDMALWAFCVHYAARFIKDLNNNPQASLTDVPHIGSKGTDEVQAYMDAVCKEQLHEEVSGGAHDDKHGRLPSFGVFGHHHSQSLGRPAIQDSTHQDSNALN